jgi:hypothetical protein
VFGGITRFFKVRSEERSQHLEAIVIKEFLFPFRLACGLRNKNPGWCNENTIEI